MTNKYSFRTLTDVMAITCPRPALGKGAAIVNAFACDACVSNQARTGPDVFVALTQGVTTTVIILQLSKVMILELICHKQEVSMRQDRAFASLDQQSLHKVTSDMCCR
jgi:hypothetical protein